MLKNKRIILIALYAGLAIYLLPMFPHGGSANELTRWATAVSLVEKGSFEISWTESLIGKNVDTAEVNGKSYSNKAPGPAVLAAPFYALTRLFTGPPDAANIRVSWFVMRLALSTGPLLLLAIWLYRRQADEFALTALLFATPLFLYSLLFFSHVLVAVLLYMAFRLLFDEDEMSVRRAVIAGVLSGIAVISEFPAVFAVMVFAAGILFTGKEDRNRRLLFFVLGGAPFALLLLLYNYELFGSPFSMSYAHESFPEWAEVAGRGVFGIGVPTFSNAYLLLFSPARGLLFSSPILLLPIIGAFLPGGLATVRERVRIAAIVLSVVVLCGHGAAHGGWAFGARYLVFVVPLMLDPFFGTDAKKGPEIWRGLLLGISILLCTLPALTFPFAPPEFALPHNTFWGMLLTGEEWFAPNLANLFGLGSMWTLLPAVLALTAVLLLLWLSVKKPGSLAPGFLMGTLAGILLVSGYIFLPGLDSVEAKFRRATIAERFYQPENRLEQFRVQAKAANDLSFLQRVNDMEWSIADARAYAPNDFPYLATRQFSASPSAKMALVEQLQKQGKTGEAESALRKAKSDFPFAACQFSANLSVIYYTTGRKDMALQELEGIQPQVNKASSPGCLRSQFLLGSLYRELGRNEDADKTLRLFMANSEGSTDAEIKDYRLELTKK